MVITASYYRYVNVERLRMKKKTVSMRISLHIDIIRPKTCFQDIENLGGLVLFLVFLCKMLYVTDYAQIGPILWE